MTNLTEPVTPGTFEDLSAGGDPLSGPVRWIIRQTGDGPFTSYLTAGDEVSEQTMPADEMPPGGRAVEAMTNARSHALATGSVGATWIDTESDGTRFAAQWIRPTEEPASADSAEDRSTRLTIPFAERSLETIYSLVVPSHFDGYAVIGSFFRPGDFGQLHAHLVIYYTGPVHWAAARIRAAEASYGVGWIEYDDDAQETIGREIERDITYGRAVDLFHAEIAQIAGATVSVTGLQDRVLAEMRRYGGTQHTEAFADGARWALQTAVKLAKGSAADRAR